MAILYNHCKPIVTRAIYILDSQVTWNCQTIKDDWPTRLLTPQLNWCSKQLTTTTAAADLSFYDPTQLNWKTPFWSKVDPCKTPLVLRFCPKIIMTFLGAKNSIIWSSQKPKFNVLKRFFVAFIIKR